MTYEAIIVDRHGDKGAVAVLTLNRPERMNAWNNTMARELSEAFSALDEPGSGASLTPARA